MKILIVSHNALTTFEAMGKTTLSLLSGFSRNELSQFYIYPSKPSVDACSSYYRITDKDVLKSYYRFKVFGECIHPDLSTNSMFEKSEDEFIYRNPRNEKPLIKILRDVMWKFAKWNNKELKSWIRNQSPDCVFVTPGGARFMYDIAMTISKEFDIPLVGYLCDEYYFVKKPLGLMSTIQVGLLKRKIKQYMSFTSSIISISEELTSLYSNYFKKPVSTIMTGCSIPISEHVYDNRKGVISYFGNIRYNRYISLVEIGKQLEMTGFRLEIHTSEKDSEIINTLSSVPSIKLCSFVTGDEYVEALHNSDYLLHVEAFDEDCIDSVRNSISTKIADSMASGVPLIAFGPKDIASIKHLLRNECAFVITEEENLHDNLIGVLLNPDRKEIIVKNALKVASEFHNPEINKVKVKAVFDEVLEEKYKC